MQPLWIVLSSVALLAGPATQDEPVTAAQDLLRRVARLPAEQQRIWLVTFQQRMTRAVRLSMPPAEAVKEEARLAELFSRKPVPWPTMVELVRQLDQREKAAISRLVRQYRSQVYETFRGQDQAILQRQEAWFRVWSSWEKAGSPPEQQDRLMDWLETAGGNLRADSTDSLPPEPKFGGAELLPPQLAKAKPAEPPKVEPSIVPLNPDPAPLMVRVPDPQAAALARPSLAMEQDSATGGLSSRARSALLDKPAVAPLALLDKSAVAPLALLDKPAVAPEEMAVAIRPGMSDHDPTTLLPRLAAVPPPIVAPTVAAGGDLPPPRSESAPNHANSDVASDQGHVGVNLAELTVRIAGVNAALRTIEAELEEKRPWTADQLDRLLNRLDILVLRQQDLELFRGLITPDQRAKVGKIEPPRQAITSLAGRIAELRTRLQAAADNGDASPQNVLKHLDELSDRLVGLTVNK